MATTYTKHKPHTCPRCGLTFESSPLGRPAHDKYLSHVATVHHFYRPRACTKSSCKGVK